MKPHLPQRRPFAGLVVIGLGASLAAMDLAVNVSFPAVSAAFSLATAEIRWLVICYVLTYASLTLAFGRLGDRIGHRRVFRAGLLVSLGAFAAAGLAQSYPTLLGARVAQGVGTAMLLSCAPALATQLFAEAHRTRALAAYSSAFSIAGVIAPLAGGASIEWLGWSGVYWFRVPVAAAALALMPLLPKHIAAPASPGDGRADLAASTLLAGTLALLLGAVVLVPSPLGVGGALALAVPGLATAWAFLRHQRSARSPILPRSATRDPDFVLPNLLAIAVQFVAFAVPLLVPYYLARVGGYGSAGGGALLVLSPIGVLAGSALAATLARVAGARPAALAGACMLVAGSLAIGHWGEIARPGWIMTSLLAQGIGLGLFQVAYTDVVVAALPREARGVAGSLAMVTRTIGVVTAATVLAAAVAHGEHGALARAATPAAAFAQAFGWVFTTSAIVLAVLLAASCLRRSLWFGR